jgi:hypothetical protein
MNKFRLEGHDLRRSGKSRSPGEALTLTELEGLTQKDGRELERTKCEHQRALSGPKHAELRHRPARRRRAEPDTHPRRSSPWLADPESVARSTGEPSSCPAPSGREIGPNRARSCALSPRPRIRSRTSVPTHPAPPVSLLTRGLIASRVRAKHKGVDGGGDGNRTLMGDSLQVGDVARLSSVGVRFPVALWVVRVFMSPRESAGIDQTLGDILATLGAKGKAASCAIRTVRSGRGRGAAARFSPGRAPVVGVAARPRAPRPARRRRDPKAREGRAPPGEKMFHRQQG